MSFKSICKVDVISFVFVLMIIFIPRNSLENSDGTTTANVNDTVALHSTITESHAIETTKPSKKAENDTNPVVNKFFDSLGKNKDMLLRALYVLIAVTTIVIIYFGIKAWRVHRRKSKSRKYGIITKGADLEMEPLGKGDDDEEDLTVFEINNKNKKK